ncbi:hypothetical protein L1987_89756 [Smallanthus sonchifolius]|nr:hypothetical protein L1987_89756 [Smallanthus sonchifolius]
MAALAAPHLLRETSCPRASFASILAGTSSSSPAVTKAPVKPILPDILLLNNPLLQWCSPFLQLKSLKLPAVSIQPSLQSDRMDGPSVTAIRHSPTECRKALAKKTPRLPPASTAVAPKLPSNKPPPPLLILQRLKTNLLKLHGVSALVTKRKRLWSLNTKKLPEPVTSKSGLVTTATIEQNDLYCTPHNAPD